MVGFGHHRSCFPAIFRSFLKVNWTAQINKFKYCHSIDYASCRWSRSEKAKAQRESGKRGFDSAFTDDPFEKLLDPDYEPSEASDNKQSDTEDEEHDEYAVTCPQVP